VATEPRCATVGEAPATIPATGTREDEHMSNDDSNYDVEAEIDELPGSPLAKKRARIVLRTLSGRMLPKEACQALGIDEAELEQLQKDLVEGAMRGVMQPRDPTQN